MWIRFAKVEVGRRGVPVRWAELLIAAIMSARE